METVVPRTLEQFKAGSRVALIIVLALASLIPLVIVDGLSNERRSWFEQASHEVANSWGRAQVIAGPVLIVPVDYTPPANSGWQKDVPGNQQARRHVVLLPDTLAVNAEVDHELRKRSIYEIALFSADIELLGEFRNARSRITEHIKSLGGEVGVVDWSGARLVLGISDPRAIRLPRDDAGVVRWNDQPGEFLAGSLTDIMGSSVQMPLELQSFGGQSEKGRNDGQDKVERFAIQLRLGATESLAVTALGGNTHYELASRWPHPSFSGGHLPVAREISASGFTAEWEVHALARNLPDLWVHENQPRAVHNAQMAVSFHNPVTPYTIVDRGIKYGLLFIALTFLTFLCFELTAGLRFHILQYGVVALGLVMFYLTLLATSEHLPFGQSYTLATGLIVTLLAAYTWAMTRQNFVTTVIVCVLLGLYATLFVLLQLEDYALLMGTALLLAGLAALMYATRSIHLATAAIR